MKGYLFDTDVISLFAPGRKPVSDGVSRWVEDRTDRLFISAISVGEIEAGLSKLRRDEAFARANRIADWFERLLTLHNQRILPFDREVAHIYGATLDRALSKGHEPGFADAAIAATAIRFGLSVVTRNVRHFRLFEAPLLNPDDFDTVA